MIKYPSVLLGKLERFRQDRWRQQNWGAGATPDCGAQHNSENLELPGAFLLQIKEDWRESANLYGVALWMQI